MATSPLNRAIAQTLFKVTPPMLRGMTPGYKSQEWIDTQQALAQQAAQAGLPVIQVNPQESSARAQLMDAIARSQTSGYKFPYFTGTPNEPTGDRAAAMDIEGLVNSLKLQEQAAIKAKNIPALDRISRERAYWEKELADSMTAAEWKAQTGEESPVYPQ